MDYKNIYLIGIGGIGMSALARYFKAKKCFVAGYDLNQSNLTHELEHENIEITYTDDDTLIPQKIKKSPQNTLVIYTPAVPVENNIYNYFRSNNFEIKKRAEVLGDISREYFTIAIAGTHGKTTISTLIAHILTETDYGCNALLGGIALNYDSNLILSNKKTMVVEADEYDKSFLNLHPDIAIITAIDSDHLDIYSNYENLKATFIDFANNIKPSGKLIVNEKINNIFTGLDKNIIGYGIGKDSIATKVSNIKYYSDYTIFDLKIHNMEITAIKIPLLGNYNIENVVAAVIVANILKIDNEKIKKALLSFKGIKRRAQYIIKNEKIIFIDDYAHHPAEIDAILQSVKTNYKDKKITVIFQPHLYSRTKDLAKDFAKSLSQADNIILMDIYPAREQKIEGITYKTIAKYINKDYFFANSSEEILNLLKKLNIEVLLTLGAGDIYKHIDSIKQLINNE